MCKHRITELIESDEQALFTVLYCEACDYYFDGYGNSLELIQQEMIEQ
jgi:hypothetical protein